MSSSSDDETMLDTASWSSDEELAYIDDKQALMDAVLSEMGSQNSVKDDEDDMNDMGVFDVDAPFREDATDEEWAREYMGRYSTNLVVPPTNHRELQEEPTAARIIKLQQPLPLVQKNNRVEYNPRVAQHASPQLDETDGRYKIEDDFNFYKFDQSEPFDAKKAVGDTLFEKKESKKGLCVPRVGYDANAEIQLVYEAVKKMYSNRTKTAPLWIGRGLVWVEPSVFIEMLRGSQELAWKSLCCPFCKVNIGSGTNKASGTVTVWLEHVDTQHTMLKK